MSTKTEDIVNVLRLWHTLFVFVCICDKFRSAIHPKAQSRVSLLADSVDRHSQHCPLLAIRWTYNSGQRRVEEYVGNVATSRKLPNKLHCMMLMFAII